MILKIERSGGAEDGETSTFELHPGDVIAWHDGPVPVRETDPPIVLFKLTSENELLAVVRMR